MSSFERLYTRSFQKDPDRDIGTDEYFLDRT